MAQPHKDVWLPPTSTSFQTAPRVHLSPAVQASPLSISTSPHTAQRAPAARANPFGTDTASRRMIALWLILSLGVASESHFSIPSGTSAPETTVTSARRFLLEWYLCRTASARETHHLSTRMPLSVARPLRRLRTERGSKSPTCCG